MVTAIKSVRREDPADVEYPESDGKPLGESGIHVRETLNAIGILRAHFGEREDVYVCGDQFMYWEKGNPRVVVSPDVYVILGVSGLEERRVIKVWEEGKAPDLVLEVTSRSTRREDLVHKRRIYASLGVREYFLFDPFAEYLRPHLQGFRLEGGEYVPLLPDPRGALLSSVAGIWLRPEGSWLQFLNLDGILYPPPIRHTGVPSDYVERAQKSLDRLRADIAEAALRNAEEARTRAEEERARAEEERARAEEERARAEEERARAEEERRHAEARTASLEQELIRLRARLEHP